MQQKNKEKLCFEFPLNERMRSLLRIEHLFKRYFDALETVEQVWAQYFALQTIFEIMDCASRAEFKMELLQELERQRQLLLGNQDNQDKQDILAKLNDASHDLQIIQKKFAQNIRDNEWLMLIKQKMHISGGTSPVDFPSYYFWQNISIDRRLDNLKSWSKMITPTYEAIALLLSILRNKGVLQEFIAQKGSFQYPGIGKNIQLIQVKVSLSLNVIPDISANRHVTHIHFLENDFFHSRGKQVQREIPFILNLCGF